MIYTNRGVTFPSEVVPALGINGIYDLLSHGCFRIPAMPGRCKGSNTRIFRSSATNSGVPPTSDNDWICSSSEISSSLGGIADPVDSMKKIRRESGNDVTVPIESNHF